MIEKFTICVLLFGDHFNLAKRCLSSLVSDGPLPVGALRIGLNAVSPATRQLAMDTAAGSVWEYTDNRHKYPVMREMIHGISPITTPYTVWFDDDSYLTQPLQQWLPQVEQAMQQADMLGSLYRIKWQGRQREYVKAQPWYNGKDPAARPGIQFATGGWWVIRTELLYRYDYPWPELDHRGGDVMLGELCHQQGLRLKHFRTGVSINADHTGRESRAPRRGFNQPPIGVNFEPGIANTLHRATTNPLSIPVPISVARPAPRRIIEL